jgi:hypothetical protein
MGQRTIRAKKRSKVSNFVSSYRGEVLKGRRTGTALDESDIALLKTYVRALGDFYE